MAIEFSCESCGKHYRLADRLAGRQAKCSCGHIMQVPAPAVVHAQAEQGWLDGFDDSSADPLPALPITGPRASPFWDNPAFRRASYAIIAALIAVALGAVAIKKLRRNPVFTTATQAPAFNSSASAPPGAVASSQPNSPKAPAKSLPPRHRSSDLPGLADSQCRRNIIAIGEALATWSVHNEGDSPANMGQLLWSQGVTFSSLKPEAFICPKSGKTIPSKLTGQDLRDWITKNTDYDSPAFGSHKGVERLLLYEKWVSENDDGTTVLEIVRAQPVLRWVSIQEAKRLIAEEREATGP